MEHGLHTTLLSMDEQTKVFADSQRGKRDGRLDAPGHDET
jgi:hypothetical protein